MRRGPGGSGDAAGRGGKSDVTSVSGDEMCADGGVEDPDDERAPDTPASDAEEPPALDVDEPDFAPPPPAFGAKSSIEYAPPANVTNESIEGELGRDRPLSETDISAPRHQHLLFPLRKRLADHIAERPNRELAEAYWLDRPFAMAAIIHRKREDDYTYRVVEPELNQFEKHLYDDLQGHLREELLYRIDISEGEDKAAVLEEKVRETLDRIGVDVDEPALQKLLYYLRRDLINFGKIEPLMQDPRLEEISCDGDDIPIYVHHRDYENLRTNVAYEEAELRRFVNMLAQRSGKDISVASPMLGTALPDGSRVQLSLGKEVTAHGSTFTIRKFREQPFTPVDLIDLETFTVEEMAYLWLMIETGHSALIAGGTGSGKTTTLNAISLFVPPQSKIVSIEDTREIKLPHENWIPAITREGLSAGDEGIDMYELLRAAMRQRPEYILVGEVRGEEAYTLFQAMSTGHTTYSTLHADSVETVFSRLENPPMSIERDAIAELDLIAIQTEATVDGQKVRRNSELVEVLDLDPNTRTINYRELFEWDEASDQIKRLADSRHAERLREQGRDPDEGFTERMEVLEYLLENDITNFRPVSKVIRSYMTASDYVIEQVRSGELDLAELEEIEQG